MKFVVTTRITQIERSYNIMRLLVFGIIVCVGLLFAPVAGIGNDFYVLNSPLSLTEDDFYK